MAAKSMKSPLAILASVTGTRTRDWEPMAGPDGHVGVDYWYRHCKTGQEAYVKLDQGHLNQYTTGRANCDTHTLTARN